MEQIAESIQDNSKTVATMVAAGEERTRLLETILEEQRKTTNAVTALGR